MSPERQKKLKNLTVLRDMQKAMVDHLRTKGKVLATKPNKTIKEIATLTVKTNKARNDLYCTQYYINALICGR